MSTVRSLMGSKLGRLCLAGAILLALSAPALAGHFDFENPPTAADLEVDCPSVGEEPTPEETAACDAAVAGAMEDLEGYDHPENHGKYVSFLAHCLKGMKGKGEKMSEVAQSSGTEAEELAVKLCAEFKAEQAAEDSLSSLQGKGKGKGKGSGDDGEVESEDEENEDSENVKGHNNKGGKGRGSHHEGS